LRKSYELALLLLLLIASASPAKKHDASEFTLKAEIIAQGKATSPGMVLPPACPTCGSVITRRHEHTVFVEILSFPQSSEAKQYETIGDRKSGELTIGSTYPATFDGMTMLLLLPDGKVSKLKVQTVRLKGH
jgi:hypothetical protein